MGAKQAVIDETVAQLRKDFPGVKIVGYRNGYIKTDEEKTQLLADIVEKKPDVVFAYRLIRQPSRIKRQIFLVKFLAMLELGKI